MARSTALAGSTSGTLDVCSRRRPHLAAHPGTGTTLDDRTLAHWLMTSGNARVMLNRSDTGVDTAATPEGDTFLVKDVTVRPRARRDTGTGAATGARTEPRTHSCGCARLGSGTSRYRGWRSRRRSRHRSQAQSGTTRSTDLPAHTETSQWTRNMRHSSAIQCSTFASDQTGLAACSQRRIAASTVHTRDTAGTHQPTAGRRCGLTTDRRLTTKAKTCLACYAG